jgi:predicted transposase/invertase (TIGR01784 family)
MKTKGNEKYKDNIFRYLFSDEKNFAQLYYDLTGQQLEPSELEFYDTESIVVKQLKNDVAFKTKDNRLIIMVEHQSTLNENMPLRFLLYYAELLKLYISQKGLNIFSRRAIHVPRPEFYVVYNGETSLKNTELQLKANLDGNEDFIRIKVKIVDITYAHLSQTMKQRNDILEGYSYFMGRIRFYHKIEKMILEEAIQKAIDDTLTKDYLIEYLNRKEFITMITKVLTIEEEMDLIREEERKEGRQEGEYKKAVEGTIQLLKIGMDEQKITEVLGLPLDKVLEIKKELQKERKN